MPEPPRHPNEVTPLLRAHDPSYSGAASNSNNQFKSYSAPQHVHHNQVIHDGDLGKDPHSQFCALTGCPPTNAPPGFKYRLNERTLYGRAQNEANIQNKMYWFTATLTNFLLLIQIVLGALLTGLGGSNVPGYVITVIGAVNTVIAGVVTYLKSRGQPMRARAFRDELNFVVDEIENSEVMWLGIAKGAHGYTDLNTDTAVTVRSEVARLTCLLEEAIIRDSQNNPEQYSTGVAPQIGLGQFGGLRKYTNTKDPETTTYSGIASLEDDAAKALKSGKEPAAALSSLKSADEHGDKGKGEDQDKKKSEDKKKEVSDKAESSNTSSETKTSDSKGKQTSTSSTNTTTAFSSIGSFLPSITESKREEKNESTGSTSKKEQDENDEGSGTGFSLTDN